MKLARLIPLVLVTVLLLGAKDMLQPRPTGAQAPLPIGITKSFTPASIVAGGTSVLRITLTNPNAFQVNNITFTDTLPAAITVNPLTLISTCGVGWNFAFALTNASMLANSTCFIQATVTSSTVGTHVNTTSTVTATVPGAVLPPGGPAVATLVVTAAPTPTTVPSTPVPATATPTVIALVPPVVVPQVFQHVPSGIFNGSRNNTPTPVRPAAAVVAGAPAAMPQVRPPSTGESGLADNGASNVVYGLAFIAALGVVTFGATRLKSVRNR